jgi:hypothetical protein
MVTTRVRSQASADATSVNGDHRVARLRIGEHPARLQLEVFPRRQRVGRGGIEELLVRHRAPQQIGQAARHLVGGEQDVVAIAGRFGAELDAIDERRRLQHRREQDL